jgi:hypothetical protein
MLSLIGDRPRRRRSSIPLLPQSSAMIPSVMGIAHVSASMIDPAA